MILVDSRLDLMTKVLNLMIITSRNRWKGTRVPPSGELRHRPETSPSFGL